MGVDLHFFMLDIRRKLDIPLSQMKRAKIKKLMRLTLTYLPDLMSVKNKKMMMTKVLVRHSSFWVAHKSLN